MTRLTDVIRAATPTAPVGIVQRFGTVEDVAPIRVRMDGDQQAIPVSFIALCRPRKGDRVAVLVVGTMRIITGIIGGDSTPDNTLMIGGTEYQASGTMGVPAFTFTSYPPMHVASVTVSTPYVPPSGYGFHVYCLKTGGFTAVTTAGQSATNITLRVMQVQNDSTTALTRIGWRLTKL